MSVAVEKSSENKSFGANFIYENTPNFSMRMTAIAAILVRNQLRQVSHKIDKFNHNWWILYDNLNGCFYESLATGCKMRIEVAPRHPDEEIVGTSFLFNVMLDMKDDEDEKYKTLEAFSKLLSDHGVAHAWFGRKQCSGFTSTFKHWRYVDNKTMRNTPVIKEEFGAIYNELDNSTTKHEAEHNNYLAKTNLFLSTLFDIPLYHTSSWHEDDFLKISRIIKTMLQYVRI